MGERGNKGGQTGLDGDAMPSYCYFWRRLYFVRLLLFFKTCRFIEGNELPSRYGGRRSNPVITAKITHCPTARMPDTCPQVALRPWFCLAPLKCQILFAFGGSRMIQNERRDPEETWRRTAKIWSCFSCCQGKTGKKREKYIQDKDTL